MPCLQGPGRARSTLEFFQCLLNLFALSWRTSFLGHFISPVALLFEGSLLPGQRGAVMNLGSLQSSALLLLPRITYARLAHIKLPAQGGWRESLLLAGLVVLLGKLEEWPPSQCSQSWQQQEQPRFEPRLEDPLQKTTHLQAESAMEQGGSLQSLLAPSQAGLARGRNSLGGEGAPPSSWELTDIPAPGIVSAHPLWICSCVRGAEPRPRISGIRAGLYCCFVLLSVTNVAILIQKCPLKSSESHPGWGRPEMVHPSLGNQHHSKELLGCKRALH